MKQARDIQKKMTAYDTKILKPLVKKYLDVSRDSESILDLCEQEGGIVF